MNQEFQKKYTISTPTVEENLANNGFKDLPKPIMDYIKTNKQGRICMDELPTSLQIGARKTTIKKILLQGNVLQQGFEIGMLAIPAGEGIQLHTHLNDGEKYMVLSPNSSFQITGEEEPSTENICGIGQKHGIEPGQEDITILNIKVAKEILKHIDLNEITPENIFSNNIQVKLEELSNEFKINTKLEENQRN
ncbi:MAG: hypothetical protein HFJ37_02860 [Clostridia bacterium]|nr:hypothetical protein [Clostridia bacterium]